MRPTRTRALHTMKITLSNRDELFVIRLEAVAWFTAEDHYTHVCYINGNNAMLPFGLSEICEAVFADNVYGKRFLRVSRSVLLNLGNVSRVSLLKEELTFTDVHGRSARLRLSKRLLRDVAAHLKGEKTL